MYLPKHFARQDHQELQDFIVQYPFGTLATAIDGKVEMNHLPFYLDREHQCLQAHIPRANPLYQELNRVYEGENPHSIEVLVAFHGPNAYITPSWYPSKKEHGKVVPTWNYTVVHARGTLQMRSEESWLTQHLSHLTDQQEPTRNSTWQMHDAPQEYTASMMRVLCGLEISITELSGKYKVSQNREDRDKEAVLSHLSSSDDVQERALAEFQKQAQKP
jgi:transcriptional regulator